MTVDRRSRAQPEMCLPAEENKLPVYIRMFKNALSIYGFYDIIEHIQ